MKNLTTKTPRHQDFVPLCLGGEKSEFIEPEFLRDEEEMIIAQFEKKKRWKIEQEAEREREERKSYNIRLADRIAKICGRFDDKNLRKEVGEKLWKILKK